MTLFKVILKQIRSKPPVLAQSKGNVEPNPFVRGDDVMLKSDKNPYKGTLKCGKAYYVVAASMNLVAMVADNGTMGYFRVEHFEKAKFSPPKPGR